MGKCLRAKTMMIHRASPSGGITCSAASSSPATLPSALLFDCDGVLVDTEKDGHRISFNDTFKERELGVTWDVDLYGELLNIGGGKERYLLQEKKRGKALDSVANFHLQNGAVSPVNELVFTEKTE